MDFLIVLISALGFGHFFSYKRNDFFKMPGLYLFSGYMCIPFVMFFSDTLIPNNLDVISKIIFSITALSSGLLLYRNKNDLKTNLTHPVFILSFIALLPYLIFSIDYKIHSWDEYSHWLLMPKQIFIENTLQSTNFLYKQFMSYTPGWPALIDYPVFVVGKEFRVDGAYQVSTVGSIAIVGIVFDIVKLYSKRNIASGYILLVIFIIVIIKGFQEIFATDILVEMPLTQVIFSCFLILFLIEVNPKSWKINSFILSLFLASGYLIKKPFFVVIPIVVVAYIITTWKIHGSKKILSVVGLLCPWILVAVIWKYKCATNQVSELWKYPIPQQQEFFVMLFSEKSQIIFFAMIKESLNLLIRYFYTIPLIYYAVRITKKEQVGKITLYSFFALLIIYFISMYWSYLTIFSDYEALRAASFKRYICIIWRPLVAFLLIVCSVHLWDRYHQRFEFFYKKNVYIAFYFLFFVMLVVSLIQIMGKERDQMEMAVNSILSNIDSDIPHKVLFISQGSAGKQMLSFKYHSLLPRKKNLFSFHTNYSFGETKENVWMTKVSEIEMSKLILSSDIVLIWNSNPWLDSVIRNNLKISCSENYTSIYLIKTASGGFKCEKLNLNGNTQ